MRSVLEGRLEPAFDVDARCARRGPARVLCGGRGGRCPVELARVVFIEQTGVVWDQDVAEFLPAGRRLQWVLPWHRQADGAYALGRHAAERFARGRRPTDRRFRIKTGGDQVYWGPDLPLLPVVVVCPACGARNRLTVERLDLADGAVSGPTSADLGISKRAR